MTSGVGGGVARITEDCKMVILVRTDINMGKGKAAAQCCHAVLETYKMATRKHPAVLAAWEQQGQPKVTLRVESEEQLDELVQRARQAGLPAASIRDAGRTQVLAGTKTVAAIGPGPIKMVDLITGHLKLY
jgi:PTH2 family peptidyl-tRNA hydrolase